MQSLWSRLKTGEANKPGSYSKNTISIISNLEKSDAQYIYNNTGIKNFLIGETLLLSNNIKALMKDILTIKI